jgi:hypothetical protein
MRSSNAPLDGLLPNVATRPSGRRIAEEWYPRGTVWSFAFVQVFAAGS